MTNVNQSRRVKILRDSVARKIAAGEVIDRPFSVVRELLDNALDAGSSQIELSLEQGGLSSIVIKDNGHGMNAEDLKLSCLPHATSKIASEQDLENIHSLGFRGEALASVSTCSRLSITSCEETPHGWKIVNHGGKQISIDKVPGTKGTTIEVKDLFYSLPARRKFMKRPSAETGMCKKTFLEKAVPFPEISFKYSTEGKLKQFLPASTALERVQNCWPDQFPLDMLNEAKKDFNRFSINIIMGRPELARKDRKYLHIYVNKRRINEYSLQQAVEYGYNEYLPGGLFPVAFVFLQIDPSLVDFNIHPAKREARFRNIPELHHALSVMVKEELRQYSYSARKSILTGSDSDSETKLTEQNRSYLPYSKPEMNPVSGSGFSQNASSAVFKKAYYTDKHRQQLSPENLRELPALPQKEPIAQSGVPFYKYLGQIMNLFLLIEKDETLFIIDQHAAHERIIYDRLVKKGPDNPQKLLFPLEQEMEENEISTVEKNKPILEKMGINIETDSDTVRITALPPEFIPLGKSLFDFIKGVHGARTDWEREAYDRIACRSAVKDGLSLDELSAREIIEGVLKMNNARCPHGRPIYIEMSRHDLYKQVEREF